MTELVDDFVSDEWIDPEPELRLVNGVWVAIPRGKPPSSSANFPVRKPTSLRERQELDAEAKAAEEAAKAASGEGEEEGAGADDAEPEPAS